MLATIETLGGYLFTVNLYINRKPSKEPLPWAMTIRDGEQGIQFHIDTKYSLKEFQMDWTAAHELSHLSIPYVGRSNMWFSEGYASFWQWQILMQQGLYSEKEVMAKYMAKFNRIKGSYDTSESFLNSSNSLKSRHNYPGVYWGGACYFFKVNELLKSKHNTSLGEVIKIYQTTYRLKDEGLHDVILSLDKISKSKAFSSTLKTFESGSEKEVVLDTKLIF